MFNCSRVISKLRQKTYFTIRTSKGVGFTDQMMQYSAFYKLGTSLGFHYVFSPLDSNRSKPMVEPNSAHISHNNGNDDTFNVYDFLGFNQYFSQKKYNAALNNAKNIKVELNDSIIESHNINSFKDLQSYVREFVLKKNKNGRQVIVIFRLSRKKTLAGTGGRKFFSMIHSNVPIFQDGLDFRAMYFSTREKDSVKFPIDNSKPSLLVHIRQGDTGFIDTPWNTFIPVNRGRPDFLIEQDNLEGMINNHNNKNFYASLFQPEDYYNFVATMISFFEKCLFDISVFSDGYQRAFNIIEKNIDRLDLDTEKSGLLNTIREDYDKNKFSIFNTLENCKLVIGETGQGLRELIHSTITSDIIIVAAQQRMLPKLAANFCEKEKPLIIVLYRKDIPDFSDVIQDDGKRFLYTDIEKPDFTALVEDIKKKPQHVRLHFNVWSIYEVKVTLLIRLYHVKIYNFTPKIFLIIIPYPFILVFLHRQAFL